MHFRIEALTFTVLAGAVAGCSIAPPSFTQTTPVVRHPTSASYRAQAYATAEFPAQIGKLTLPATATVNQPVAVEAWAARPTPLDVITGLRIAVATTSRTVQVTALRQAPLDRLVILEFQGYAPITQTFVPTVPGTYQILADRGVNLPPLTLEVRAQ